MAEPRVEIDASMLGDSSDRLVRYRLVEADGEVFSQGSGLLRSCYRDIVDYSDSCAAEGESCIVRVEPPERAQEVYDYFYQRSLREISRLKAAQ